MIATHIQSAPRLRPRLTFAVLVAAGLLPAQDGTTLRPPPQTAVERPPATVDTRLVRAPAADFTRLGDIANRNGTVRAIAGLQVLFTPEGALTAANRTLQRERIAAAQASVTAALAGTQFQVLRTYSSVPAIALSLSSQAVGRLAGSGLVASIGEDMVLTPSLGASTVRVEATETAVFGRTGVGQHVAILDTGVQASHPFFTGRVVSEACFSSNASCPGGLNTATGSGSAAPCTYSGSCGHGTHVAGIAAGNGSGFSGVARGARIVAVQVFSNISGSPGAYTSDILAGLNYVNSLTVPVASVNLSLGGGLYTAACDANSSWSPVKTAIDNLRSRGIATVVAAGNDGSKTSISGPACISTAIAVGAVDANDGVFGFSNSSAQVQLLAPGQVNSSLPGGLYGVLAGTSMAAPHVAGAFAVLKQTAPAASVAALTSHLAVTGLPVTDTNTIARPRIRVLAASARMSPTGFVNAASFTGNGSMNVVSNGVGLATRAGASPSGAIAISGIPGGSSILAAHLYWMTLGGPDDTVMFQGVARKGVLVGASQNPCWGGVNPSGPARVYRAILPAGAVPGNGTYSLSGAGSPAATGWAGMDGQGASLVVVYQPPFYELGANRVIRVRHGAMSTTANGTTMSHTFPSLTVPRNPSSVELHVGVGDAQGTGDTGMFFAGSPVTGVNYFAGLKGPLWDAAKITVPTTLLPASTTSATNTLGSPAAGNGDCQSWGYSVLSYKWIDPPPVINPGN